MVLIFIILICAKISLLVFTLLCYRGENKLLIITHYVLYICLWAGMIKMLEAEKQSYRLEAHIEFLTEES